MIMKRLCMYLSDLLLLIIQRSKSRAEIQLYVLIQDWNNLASPALALSIAHASMTYTNHEYFLIN